MEKHSTEANPSANWAQIIFFRIYKDDIEGTRPAIKLFNNTRQRCPVRVALVAADSNGNPVLLSEGDLRTLELIDYITNAPLSSTLDWQVSTERGEYTWDESMIPTVVESTDGIATGVTPLSDANREKRQGAQMVTLYVSTSALSRKQVAVRIPLPSTTAHVSTNHIGVVDPDGFGDGQGRFNSSVMIEPAAFPSLDIANYGVFDSQGNLLPQPVGNTDYFYRAVEHHIHISYNGRMLPLKSVSGSNSSIVGFSVHRTDRPFDLMKWGMTYYGQPGQAQPEHFPLAPLAKLRLTSGSEFTPGTMFNNCIGQIVGKSTTRVVVGLIAGNLEGKFLNSSNGEIPDRIGASMYLLDDYGNYHDLTLSFGSSADKLRITIT
ncbi:hypothetical protein [Luteibacter sp.]|jgi:hypothetical protein|uniref:hypothetical protein n=1 Tax=Luteibacter sp. TaxID=1886636 RepID=UPI002F427D98